MLTLHVGHLLVDLLEQVYHSMILEYGKVRKDSIIIIDVANADERRILQEKVKLHTNDDNDSFGLIFKALTDAPILTIDNLASLSDDISIIFKHLHLGLDLTSSSFNYGHSLGINIIISIINIINIIIITI
jgi:hypothetical protein